MYSWQSVHLCYNTNLSTASWQCDVIATIPDTVLFVSNLLLWSTPWSTLLGILIQKAAGWQPNCEPHCCGHVFIWHSPWFTATPYFQTLTCVIIVMSMIINNVCWRLQLHCWVSMCWCKAIWYDLYLILIMNNINPPLNRFDISSQRSSTCNSSVAGKIRFRFRCGLRGLYSATNCVDNILGRFTIILQNQIARVDPFTNLT